MGINQDCNSVRAKIVALDKDKISVQTIQSEQCSGCKAVMLCDKMSSKSEPLVVSQSNSNQFSIGEEVLVLTPQNKVLKAITIAFFYPILLIIGVIFLNVFVIKGGDIVLAMSCLFFIVLYFLIMYSFRHKPYFSFGQTIVKI